MINGDQLAFTRSQSNSQFWASLLEKAYAKLHGSYEALKYTTSMDVFNEITGGSTEVIPLQYEDLSLKVLTAVTKLTTISTAVCDPDRILENGIAPGFNYAVASVEQIQTAEGLVILVKLRRSPGINQVYLGPYGSPKSVEWKSVSSRDRERLGLDKLEPNEFHMCWEEFSATFGQLEIVHLDEETCQSEQRFKSAQLKAPQAKTFQGYWRRGITAGGSRNHLDSFHINPQLCLTLGAADDVIVALIQHHIQEPKVIGYSVYLLPPSHPDKVLAPNGFFHRTKALFHSLYSNSRQVLHRMSLQAGRYLIVPTTYDSGVEGTFTLRIYCKSPIALGALDNPTAIVKPVVVEAPSDGLEEYKNSFLAVADERKTLNSYELQEVLHGCLPNDYMKSCASLDGCRNVVKAFGTHSQLGRINYTQFRDFMSSLKSWAEVFSSYSKSTSGVIKAELLREALLDVGFQLSTDIAHLVLLRYMRRDGTLRFGDFVACILQLIATFNNFAKKDPNHTGQIKLTPIDWMKAVLRS